MSSCESDNETETEALAVCDSSTTNFKTIFNSLVTTTYTDEVTMDLEIHEYTFEISSDREICEIGYQSHPNIETLPYTIEIYDNTNNVSIYSDDHVFSSINTSYINPSQPINLVANVSYTIRRTQTNWVPLITNTIGRMAYKTTMAFPYTEGPLTITSSFFGDSSIGTWPLNYGLPFIDIVFTE